MIFKVKTNYYNNFEVFEKNKMSPRAYLLPYSNINKLDKSTLENERYSSDRVILLNGEWGFAYFDKVSKMPNIIDTDKFKFDKVSVPSVWQRTGYEKPNYLNSRYQFPLDPPNIPRDIPVGVYLKKFDVNSLDFTYLINFLGVASCFDLFINGKFVGYSEGSHNTAEFDISKYIDVGENQMLVVVYKWCNGSYLECQDMFRENGIFRDVFLLKEDKSYLFDIELKTKYIDNKNYNFDFSFKIENYKNNVLSFDLYDINDKLLFSDSFCEASGIKSYIMQDVAEWSAENPSLYKIIIKNESNNKSIFYRKYFGFKHVDIKGNVFYFNDQPIKILGVNYHETHPKTGYYLTVNDYIKDIELMKEYNCNAVRLSHYPHDPIFLSLCDKYGLYAIDEMDLESHGVYSNPLYRNYGLISNNLKWKNHYIDRASRMYYRDRNHVSITMWSLGNEAGCYKCHDIAYEYLKKLTDIPITYENVLHCKRHSYDVISETYPYTKVLETIGNKSIKDKRFIKKPYFAWEYAHSMGVGAGALSLYVDMFRKYDNLVGGCIWEFCDHVVEGVHDKYRYAYGGDFNEKKHDKNFCVDGVFFPDRSPSTAGLNMKQVYMPYSVEFDGESLIIKNLNYFVSSNGVFVKYAVLENGKTIYENSFGIDILPQCTKSYHIDNVELSNDKEYYLLVEFYNDKNSIGYRNIHINGEYKTKCDIEYANLNISKERVVFNNDEIFIELDKKTGEFLSYKIKDKDILNTSPILHYKGLLPNLYRTTIDNDMFIAILWKVLGLLKAKAVHTKSIMINDYTLRSYFIIKGNGRLAKVYVDKIFYHDGTIKVEVVAKKCLKLLLYNDITRLGVTLELDKSFDNITYYGLGDRETLSDFNEHGKIGIFDLKVKDMHEKYIKPQESGNRSDVRYFSIANNEGRGIQIVKDNKLLNLNANHFTRYELDKATHQEELKEVDTTCLQIDGYMRGAGSQSCGQQPTIEHRPNLKTSLVYSFYIKPLKN